MKIIDKRTEKKEYTFKDLVCGNVFEYSGDIYLKLDTSGEDNNAYNLNTCKFATLSDDAVMPIETELVIRDTKNMTARMTKQNLLEVLLISLKIFLDKKGVTLEPPKKSYEMELDGSMNANIYGTDYDSISDSLESLLRSWKVIE